MGPELLAYPFLFISIFFETFILVTFLSAPATQARKRLPSAKTPSVAIIVPCWNEGTTVARTVESLLALEYPKDKLEIILVDNASTDNTPEVMAQFVGHPQVKVMREERKGKHFAVNSGIAATTAELIGCLDADSFVEAGALREMIGCFDNPKVGATTAAMSVHQPANLLQHMQNAEYIFGILNKHVLSTVNGIHVTPGPFSLYRREVVVALGGFRHAYQTEDLEMALRLQRAGYLIENAPHARVYTKAPRTVLALIRQRTRWTAGFLRNILYEYRDMIGSLKYGALGSIVLPIAMPAIVGGIMMFGFSVIGFIVRTVHTFEIQGNVPLSYTLGRQGFDWFYLPSSIYLLLATVTILATLVMITLGKRISKTPGSLTLGLVSYLLLFGLIAPLWLIRATTDVALGKKRAWR